MIMSVRDGKTRKTETAQSDEVAQIGRFYSQAVFRRLLTHRRNHLEICKLSKYLLDGII